MTYGYGRLSIWRRAGYGQLLPIAISTQPSFERLFRSVSCQTLYASSSAEATSGHVDRLGPYCIR